MQMEIRVSESSPFKERKSFLWLSLKIKLCATLPCIKHAKLSMQKTNIAVR
jgi:hypothetical protein